MDAKEFLKTLSLPKNWSGEDEEYGQWLFYEKNVIEAMEQYHQSKVNNIVLDDVMVSFKPHELWRMAQKYNCDDFTQMIEQSKGLNKL